MNFHQWKDPEIDAAFSAARATDDIEERRRQYDIVTREINDAVLDVWLYNTPQALVAQPSVRGLNPARRQPFGNLYAKTWLWRSVWKQPT